MKFFIFTVLIIISCKLQATDPFGNPVILTNSMVVFANVWFDGQTPSENSVVAVYHFNQLRGKADVVLDQGKAHVPILINTEAPGEVLRFVLWECSQQTVFDCFTDPLIVSQPGSIIGWPPSEDDFVQIYTHRLITPDIIPETVVHNDKVYVVLSHEKSDAQIHYELTGPHGQLVHGTYDSPIELIANAIYNFKIYANHDLWFFSESIDKKYVVISSPFNIEAEQSNNGVVIRWELANLDYIDGFNVYRRKSNEETWMLLNDKPVSGLSFIDNLETNNISFYYAVTALHLGFESNLLHYSNVLITDDEFIKAFVFPNPVKQGSSPKLKVNVNYSGNLTLTLYDFTGRRIRVDRVDFPGNNKCLDIDLKTKSGIRLARGSYFLNVVGNSGEERINETIKISISN